MKHAEVFFNVSNHPSINWSEKQRESALELASTIRDIKFPNVDPTATTEGVYRLANMVVAEIVANEAKHMVCMVQGEFSLTYMLTKALLGVGANVVVATTERKAIETVSDDGTTTKSTVFEFVQFRSLIPQPA